MPRIRIGEKTYDQRPLNGLPLRHLLTFKADTAAIGLPSSWTDIEAASAEMEKLPEDKKMTHPNWELVYCAMIWVTLLAAGENIRFAEVIEIDMGSIELIADPEPVADPTPGEAAPSSPKASVEADEPPEVASAAEVPTLS